MAAQAIHKAMIDVMEQIGAITKDQTNLFDKYQFRGIDDVYGALQPALLKAGVFIVPSVDTWTLEPFETSQGKMQFRAVVTVDYTFIAQEDGSSVVSRVIGEGADRGDKAINKAMSSAYKNLVFQTFCVPVEEGGSVDSEADEKIEAPPKAPAKKKGTRRKPPEEQVAAKELSLTAKEEMLTKQQRVDVQNITKSRLVDLQMDPELWKGVASSCVRKVGFDFSGEVPQSHFQQLYDYCKNWTPPKETSEAEGFVDEG